MISTVHDSSIVSKTKRNQTRDIPQIIHDYNHTMGDVDRVSQVVDPMSVYKVYKKLFFMVVDYIVKNSFVVFSSRNPCSRKAYFSALVHNSWLVGSVWRGSQDQSTETRSLDFWAKILIFWNCMSLKRTAPCFADVLFPLQKKFSRTPSICANHASVSPWAQHPTSSTFTRKKIRETCCSYVSIHHTFVTIIFVSFQKNFFLVKRCGLYIKFSRTVLTLHIFY